MIPQAKKYLTVALIVLIGFLVWVVVSIAHSRSLSAIIDIESAPTGTSIKINNKRAREGINKVKPGAYDVLLQMDGFASINRSVKVIKGQNLYVGEVLTPNSPSTAGWYQTHPADAKKAEGISSKNNDAAAAAQVQSAPFLKLLPFVQPAYRIDYGVSQRYPTDPNKFAIYLTYTSEADKQEALSWLQTKGANVSSLEIIYRQQPPILVR